MGIPATNAQGKPFVKICGLTRPEDVQAVNDAHPDLAGFILSSGYKRSVEPSRAVELIKGLDPSIAHVGVFVNEPIERIAAFTHVYDFNGFDPPAQVLVQLHGDEDERYISALRSAMAYPGWLGIPIIKAFTVQTRADVERACQSSADILLFDSGKGTGQPFDWSILEAATRPYFLAGGLGPLNVADAIARLHPQGVDMSSGVETDGQKDPAKIAAAVQAVHGT